METKGNDLDCLEATELRLGLPGTNSTSRPNKRQSPFSDDETKPKSTPSDKEVVPPAKTQVVGWPPVQSFRKNTLQAKKNESDSQPGLFVKVSMDGAPYLRKIDLNIYKSYKELHHALDVMFKCFSTGETCGKECGSEFAIAYEDKDGDWMLVGDVPWEMFTSSCKRLRIMKGSEVKGLEPKC